ncbi:MAG: polyprenyl synthetase family protein [Chlamydiota bacterium]
MDISALLSLIESALQRLFPAKDSLWESARYSLFSGGKRLRPLLTLATVVDLEHDVNTALQPACVLELIHTYSLIHDDLPCMDNDDVRRSKPTLHKIYTEGHAVLTGDFLLTHAFELLATSPNLSSEQKLDLITTLSSRAGAFGMIGGQVEDIRAKGAKLESESLRFIHFGKTAALMIASLEFAAILCKLTKKERTLLIEAGEHLGLAFQIKDDLLDSNVKEEPSAVALYGMLGAKRLAEEHFEKAQDAFNALAHPLPLLRKLSSALIEIPT